MDTQSGFDITDVTWRYERSATFARQHRVRVGIESMEVACNDCGYSWSSHSHGDGSFTATIGFYHIKCPSCGQSAAVPTRRIEHG